MRELEGFRLGGAVTIPSSRLLLAFALLTACGQTSRAPRTDDGADRAGTSGTTSGVVAAGGGGSSSTIAHGGTGGAEQSTGGVVFFDATCRDWPEGCEVKCDVPIAGCLLTADDLLPPEQTAQQTTRQLTVTGSEALPEAQASSLCGSFGEPLGAATRFKLVDGLGAKWSLVFPAQTLPLDRFDVGANLEVTHSSFTFAFRQHRKLWVRERGELVAFVMDHSYDPFTIPELDLVVEYVGLACPWTPGRCSDAYFHTEARMGATSVLDPCASRVGDLVVSSRSFVLGGAADCSTEAGICDGQTNFFASAVRPR